jgi:hypothetical protein
MFVFWHGYPWLKNERACKSNRAPCSRYSTQTGAAMSIVKRHLAENEERLVLIEEICIDKGALVYDIDSDEVFFSADKMPT